MDRKMLLKERARLQAALDGYDSAIRFGADETGDRRGDRHHSLRERIANLDRRIALSDDV